MCHLTILPDPSHFQAVSPLNLFKNSFIMYKAFCLHVYRHARIGDQISLQMLVSHCVVAGN